MCAITLYARGHELSPTTPGKLTQPELSTEPMLKHPPKKRTPPILASWIPGTGSGESTPAEIVAEFLLRTEHLPNDEAARIAGVGVGTVRKWQGGLYKNVSLRAQKRLRIFLAAREIAAHGEKPLPHRQRRTRE